MIVLSPKENSTPSTQFVEKQYDGMKSKSFACTGRYGEPEGAVLDFNRWLLNRVCDTACEMTG